MQPVTSPLSNLSVHSVTALLNRYCLEFSNWSLYEGIPFYDAPLVKAMITTGYRLFLRIDFSQEKTEAFIPLTYYSPTGGHQYQFPAFARQKDSGILYNFTEALLLKAIEKEIENTVSTSATVDEILFSTVYPIFIHRNGNAKQLTSEELLAIVETYGNNQALSLDQASFQWFTAYLKVGLSCWLYQGWTDAYFPSAFELHLENNFPVTLTHISGHPSSDAFLAHSDKKDIWVQHYLFGHIYPLISLLGNQTGLEEIRLLSVVRQLLEERQDASESLGFYLLHTRRFKQTGACLYPEKQYTCYLSNPLHQTWLIPSILQPEMGTYMFEKTFEDGLSIRIRSVNIEQDLPMLYEWFHREHAKAIWQMDWPIDKLEHFYRCLLPGPFAHSFIGEVNRIPSFNMEVYWANTDVVGNYFDVQPGDYGTHLLIAPTEKEHKHPLATMRTIIEWLFSEPKVNRLVGEGSVDSLPALINKVQAGFRLQSIIEMPHKKAHLNFCIREWYYEKFPENKPANQL